MIKRYRGLLLSVICISMVLGGTGCAGNTDTEIVQETQEVSTELDMYNEYIEKINASIVKDYNKEFEKEVLEYKFPNSKCLGQSTSSKREVVQVGRQIIYVDGLIKGDNIKSVEYLLSNCLGSFMDGYYLKNPDNESIKEGILNIESKPYCAEKDELSDIFFSVYYYYRHSSENRQQTKEIQDCLKELRITATITYEDGSQEIRNYGIEFPHESSANIPHMNVVLLK